MLHVFKELQMQAHDLLPNAHPELGSLVGIDGSLIDGSLSMLWADYRKGSKSSSLEAILEELNREPLWRGGYELAASKTADPALRTQLCLMESRFFPSINGFDRLSTLADQIHNPIILDFARTSLGSIKNRLAKPDTLRRQARSILTKARQQDDQTLIKAVDTWQRASRNPSTFL